MENAPLKWRAYEYFHSEKTTDWFWSVGLVSITLAVIAILMNNVLFAILVIVATAALVLLSLRKPNIIEVEITPRGIRAEDLFYPYSSIDSFWVEDRFFEDKLLLKSRKKLSPLISLPIDEIDPEIVRDVLLDFLPEEEHEEPLSQKIMEWFGF